MTAVLERPTRDGLDGSEMPWCEIFCPELNREHRAHYYLRDQWWCVCCTIYYVHKVWTACELPEGWTG